MFPKLLTALCAYAALSVAAGINFRPDYEFNADTKIFYKVHKLHKTWSDAVATCKLEQSELALPLSAAQAEVLKTKMGKSQTTWVGLHDKFSEGDFFTLNGVPFTEIYTNWKAGEPDDADGKADCVIMDQNGAYSDVLCNERLLFICTKEQSKVKYETACNTTDNEYFLQTGAQRCYKLHTEPRSWENALKTCSSELASLVAIESESETKLLTDNLKTIPKNTLRKNHFNKDIFWLAFSDRTSTPGDYMTLDGKPLPEGIHWAKGKPESATNDEHCVAMQRDGFLTLGNCKTLALFFCEKEPSSEGPVRIGS